MPAKPSQDLIIKEGYIKDEHTGLILPQNAFTQGATNKRRKVPDKIKKYLESHGYYDHSLMRGFYHDGYMLQRDDSTLIPYIPSKDTDTSELLLSALASGEVANVGISPVLFPDLLSIIKRQQAQAANSSIDITGRKTPVKAARDAIARFNDSPLGYTAAISEIVYNLRVFNRGCPIAIVPLNYDLSVWSENGMTFIPMPKEGQAESDVDIGYLEIDLDRVGTPVPFILDPLRIRLSGLDTWPYWYKIVDGKNYKWVLLHQSHVIPVTQGNSGHADLLGTSSVWITLGFMSEYTLIVEERVEKRIGQITNGILGISGITQTGEEISDELDAQAELRKNEGKFYGSDFTVLTSPNENVTFSFLSLRQGDVVTQEEHERMENTLVFAFGESLNSAYTRGGVGYGAASQETGRQSSDTGVGAILSLISRALGAIYKRVSIHVNRERDPAQALNLDSFNSFAEGVKDINDALGEGETLFTRDELRAIIESSFFDIPKVEGDSVMGHATGDDTNEIDEGEDGDDSQTDDSQNTNESMSSIPPHALYNAIDVFTGSVLRFCEESYTILDKGGVYEQ